MLQHLRPAVVMIVLFSILTGLAYPLAITAVAHVLFPAQGHGSLLYAKDGTTVVGSALIGQSFTSDKYFHGRPSATTDPSDSTKAVPYNADNSGASNYGSTSQALIKRVRGDVDALRKAGVAGPIPADAVTTSASGLDPDISPAFALLQVPRVAKARNLTEDKVRGLVEQMTSGRLLGLIGEPRVNVLELNLALDSLATS
jgi:K+-transporting ATPase ATPase C chain